MTFSLNLTIIQHKTGIEIQKEACDLANFNINMNHLEKRINVINDDFNEW